MNSIRPYQETDFSKLIELLQLNIPQYFARSEKQDFIDYLHYDGGHYYIMEINDELVGGGGINYSFQDYCAHISWDFIHPKYQGRGLGKSLTEYRIERIRENSSIQFIGVRTSQLAYGFYKKMGFILEKVIKDYWAEGFDLYEMKLVFPI